MWSGGRYCESEAGSRFRYAGYREGRDEGSSGSSWRELRVDLVDPVTGLRAEVFYRVLIGQGALRSWVRLSNHGRKPVTVESVTSFLCGGLSGGGPGGPAASTRRPWLISTCCGRRTTGWPRAAGRRRPLRDALPDLNRQRPGRRSPRGRFGLHQHRHLVVRGLPADGCRRQPGAPATPGPGRSSTTAPGIGRWGSTAGARPTTPGRRRHGPGVRHRHVSGPARPHRHRAPLAAHAPAGRVVQDGSGGGRGERRRIRGSRGQAHRVPPRHPAPARRPPPAAGDLQRLHEHADGRPHHRAAAAADRGGGRAGRSTSASTPAGTPGPTRAGGTRWARGSRRPPGSPTAFPRCST